MGSLNRYQRAYRSLYRWASQRLYRELAWAYEVVAWIVSLGRWDAWRRQVLDHVDDGDRVLEVGFGTGALLVAATQRELRVIGVDASRAMHRVAGRRLRRAGVAAPRVLARAQALPFAAGSFDRVIATFPTDYIVDQRVLAEVTRLLVAEAGARESGRFVITGIGFRTHRRWSRRFLGWVFGGGAEDSVEWYERFVSQLGFRVTVVDEPVGRVRVPVLILQPGQQRNEGAVTE